MNLVEPFEVESKYYGCFRKDVEEPYVLFMFKSDAENWAATQAISYEVKPINVSY